MPINVSFHSNWYIRSFSVNVIIMLKHRRLRVPSINFNGISKDLDKEEMEQLKAWYKFYHMKCWCYNRLHRNFRIQKFVCNCGIIAFSSGGIVASIITHGTALI